MDTSTLIALAGGASGLLAVIGTIAKAMVDGRRADRLALQTAHERAGMVTTSNAAETWQAVKDIMDRQEREIGALTDGQVDCRKRLAEHQVEIDDLQRENRDLKRQLRTAGIE